MINSVTLSDAISDINISKDGKLVLGGAESIMNADFTDIHYFGFGAYHVAFADPQYPPPGPFLATIEPETLQYTSGQGPAAVTEFADADRCLQRHDRQRHGGDRRRIGRRRGSARVRESERHHRQLQHGDRRLDAHRDRERRELPNGIAERDVRKLEPERIHGHGMVAFQVDDGRASDHASNTVSRSLAVSQHAVPTLVNTETTILMYSAGQVATAVTNTLGITAANGALVSATVRISAGFVGSEDSLTFLDQSGISGSYDPATGVLTLTGAASVADYRTALRSVTYVNSNLDPTEGVRTVTFQVDDGFAYNHASNIKSRGIWVTDHVAPVLSYIENEPLPYHVGQAPAQLTCYLIVELSNIETVVGATVAITSGFVSSEDVLSFVDLGLGISGDYDSSTGILTLTGAASAH